MRNLIIVLGMLIPSLVAGAIVGQISIANADPSDNSKGQYRDKCLSRHQPDGSISGSCGTSRDDDGLSSEEKKACREQIERCSSSQTGHGTWENAKKDCFEEPGCTVNPK